MADRPTYSVDHEAWHWTATRLAGTSAKITISHDGIDLTAEWSASLRFCTIKLHDDGFRLFADPQFAGFWMRLAAWGREHDCRVDMRPEQMVKILTECGFEDTTPREGPSR